MQEDTIGFRIKTIRGKKNQTEFANELGVHQHSISRYERNDRVPDTDFFKSLHRCGYDALWVMTGEKTAAPKVDMPAVIPEDDSSALMVPLYSAKAAAGHGAIINETTVIQNIPFTPQMIKKVLRVSLSDVFLLEVSGDSMEPRIKEDDIIMIDCSQTQISGGIYAFSMGDQIMVKYLQKTTPNTIQVVSENKEFYPSYTIDLQQHAHEFNLLGKVIWHSGKL